LITTAISKCAQPLLSVEELSVTYGGKGDLALSGVTLALGQGQIVGLLGESGSGKSTFAMATLGLLPASAKVSGSVQFQGTDLGKSSSDWRKIRGAQIAMIFQEPHLALSPVMRVGDQIAEVLRAHTDMDRHTRKGRVKELLATVKLTQTDRILLAYPHQLSGGELHRVAIAQAFACKPRMIIADEPTRSLDVTRQAAILELFREANHNSNCTIVFITHDPALLAGFADRVIVFYGGRVVEDGPLSQVFRNPLHPYTRGLLELVPSSLRQGSERRRLPAVPGTRPESVASLKGCVFANRCSVKSAICEIEDPPGLEAKEDHRVSCFNYAN
jgi:oligopeptide/dipeptide ABC transporter ATP-binding protein